MSILLVGAIISALVLLALLVMVLLRALDYLERHPELVKSGIPVTYILCQRMLKIVIAQYRAMESADLSDHLLAWQSPGGYRYVVNARGVDQRRGEVHHYYLSWGDIGGVGVRMQPGFRFRDRNRDGYADRRTTTGYTFYLLIVPLSGRTMSVQIPTEGDTGAVDFVATVLAFADRRKKRVNVFGFDKPPAPRYQRVPRY